MDKNKINVRYDKEGDILYILSSEGPVKDTVEVGEDVFLEIGENNEIVGIEIWQARKNVFIELIRYIEDIKNSVEHKIAG